MCSCWGENGDGKLEKYCVGETIGVGYYGFFFGGIGEGYQLVELLSVYVGAEIGYPNGISDGNRYGNLEGYILG